jgi:hypothetical protein
MKCLNKSAELWEALLLMQVWVFAWNCDCIVSCHGLSDIPMSYSWSLLIAWKSRLKWRMVRSVGYLIDFCNNFGEQILVTTECCCFICRIWRICAIESHKRESEQATLAPLIGSSIQSATGVVYNITEERS